MELKKEKVKTKCDNGACKNYADYIVTRLDTPKALELHLCNECLEEIASLYKKLKPKGGN